MYKDVLYAAAAWMQKSGDVQGWQKIAPAFSALPPSMAVVYRR